MSSICLSCRSRCLLMALSPLHTLCSRSQVDGLIGHGDHPQQAAGVRAGIADELIERGGERVVQVGQFLRIPRLGGEQAPEAGCSRGSVSSASSACRSCGRSAGPPVASRARRSMSSGWKRLACSRRMARARSAASPLKIMLAQAGVLPQVQRGLARRQRTEQHPMAGRPRQRGERPPAGDQHPRGRADQFRRELGEAAVPGRVLAGPERFSGSAGFGLRLEVGLEVVQHEQDRLIAQGADEIAREALQPLRAGELGLGCPVDGIGGPRLARARGSGPARRMSFRWMSRSVASKPSAFGLAW